MTATPPSRNPAVRPAILFIVALVCSTAGWTGGAFGGRAAPTSATLTSSVVISIETPQQSAQVVAIPLHGGASRVIATLPSRSKVLDVHGDTVLMTMQPAAIAELAVSSGSLRRLDIPGATQLGPYGAFNPDGTAAVFEALDTQGALRVEIADFRAGQIRVLDVPSEAIGFTAAWSAQGPVCIPRSSPVAHILDAATGTPLAEVSAPGRTIDLQVAPGLTSMVAGVHVTHLGDDNLTTPSGKPLANSLVAIHPPSPDQTTLLTAPGNDLLVLAVSHSGDVLVRDQQIAAGGVGRQSLLIVHPDMTTTTLPSPPGGAEIAAGALESGHAAVVASVARGASGPQLVLARMSDDGGAVQLDRLQFAGDGSSPFVVGS